MIGLDDVWVVHCQHELHLIFNSFAGFIVMLNALYGDLTASPTACTPKNAADESTVSNRQQQTYPLGQAVPR
jgi:hypothetical protein